MAANLWVVPVSAAKDGLYEEAVVISGDSDLVEPIRVANRRYGPVHVKVRVGPLGEEGTPEYDDCRAASERTGVAWRTVAQAAQRAWEASRHP